MGCVVLMLVGFLPFAEISVMIRVSEVVGFWNTLFLLIMSAFFGVTLAKLQGQVVLLKVQQCMAEGRLPATEMLDGILLFLGGVLFVIPGFITDVLGLVLIFPLTRWLIKYWLSKNVVAATGSQQSAGAKYGFRDNTSRPSEKPRSIKEPERPRGDVADAEIVE